jgi:hypothetical protein
MIPYDELCAALARWREKNGMTNGPSAHPPQGLVTPPPAAAPAAPAEASGELVFSASVSAGFGDRVPTDDGFGGEPPTAITRSPFAAEPTGAGAAAGETPILPPGPTFDETLLEGEELEPPTSVHIAAPEERSPGRDITNELEVEDIVDETDDRSDRYREPN